MPGLCEKGPLPYCLDELSMRSSARDLLKELQSAIESLRRDNFDGLEGVFQRFLFPQAGIPEREAAKLTEYLKQYWFDKRSTNLFFAQFQPIAPLYATGILKTLELSLSGAPEPVPIDSWCLVDLPQVEIINSDGKSKITLLL